MKNTKCTDSILVFEYFTASGEKDLCIVSEAEALIKSLLDDLKELDICLILNESFKYILEDYPKVKSIIINEDLFKWLRENSKNFKKSIFISAENNMNLYKISKILENNGVKTYNSSSDASMICSDKFEFYKKLYGIVPQPRSFRLKIDKRGYWKRGLENLYKKWQKEDPLSNLKIIIKPLNGVDCENIKIIDSLDEISYDFEKYFPINSRIIIQEYIEGEDVSVSLISDGEKAIPISLNSQNIVINDEIQKYLGGTTPHDSKFKDEAFEIAKLATESIKGIKGFVGVDLRLNTGELFLNDVYLLEINSRFTTPYVGLQKIANFNIARSIIDLIDGNLSIEDLKDKISLDSKAIFKKESEILDVEVIK